MSMTHLVVSDQPPRIQYVANGINQIFETPFPIFRKTAIQVFINDAEVNPTDYTVVLNIKLHATITFRLAPEQNSIITLVRNLPVERVSDFQEGGELRADTLNYEFNYQNACLQQLSDNLNRSMVMPPYAIDPKIKLTLPTPKAGKSIMWSADGQSLVNSEVEINKISTELNEKVIVATTAADTALINASVATEQADIATEKAMEAVAALNSKLNIDLQNLSTESKSFLSGFPKASTVFIDLGNIVSDTVLTAPTNGYYYIAKRGNSGQYLNLLKNWSGNYSTALETYNKNSTSNNMVLDIVCPVTKGDTVKIDYNLSGATETMKFIFAKGEI